jgi:hypothetical protein
VSPFSVVVSPTVLIDEILRRPGILPSARHQLAYALADERDGPISIPSYIFFVIRNGNQS